MFTVFEFGFNLLHSEPRQIKTTGVTDSRLAPERNESIFSAFTFVKSATLFDVAAIDGFADFLFDNRPNPRTMQFKEQLSNCNEK